ncbi:6-phosphogluconolactonase, cycloisomerase 2 family [Nakamurella panacisegetis]|uniref:6-phosphogluconolactonase, cycloisomerase 2 family n=1 Tax=Nakamurella panacisegetis TaxID=1090615 RepID=A0A1H0HKK0_9ACTN|nr:beta-propeller fold lactonase family protein [Nakamurella panacisegetis]SDO19702.1 6-phosphogluconolactonase, cycloisomerase 2 family [Nakamurella panacisegetis]
MIYVAGSAGVSVFTSDLLAVGPITPVDELLYLCPDPTGRWLFGVSGVGSGLAQAWRIDGHRIRAVGEPVGTGGTEPCHCVLGRDGRHLVVTNYGSGSVAVLPVGPDGSLGAATVLERSGSPGPDAERQDGAHPHQSVLGPGDEVLVTDLGADQVISYRSIGGRLVDPVVSSAPAGSGPRHLVLLAGDRVAVSGELDSSLLLARRDGRRLVDWRSVPATERPGADRNYPSDLLVSADGTRLYLANRGADTVAVFTVDGTRVEEVDCGAWPRQMTRSGARLLVAATRADRVEVLDTSTRRIVGDLPVTGAICVATTEGQG